MNQKWRLQKLWDYFSSAVKYQVLSMLKLRLQKKSGLTYNELNKNIQEVIKTIPKSYYKNILKGTYNRTVYMKKKIIRKYKNYKD